MRRSAESEPAHALRGPRAKSVSAALAPIAAVLCVAGPAAILLGLAGAPRALVLTSALVGAPALACSLLAGIPDRVLAIAVGLAGSFSTIVLISTCLLYLDRWSPLLLVSGSSVVSLVMLLVAGYREGIP